MLKFHENNDMKLFNKCASCGLDGPQHILQIGPISVPLCRDCMIELMNSAMSSVIYNGEDCNAEPIDQGRQMLSILYSPHTSISFDKWLRQLSYVIPRAFKLK